jgi:hypothetical protein
LTDFNSTSTVLATAGRTFVDNICLGSPALHQLHKFRVSYVSDALSDLVRATADVCARNEPQAITTWEEEPGLVFCRVKSTRTSTVEIDLRHQSSAYQPPIRVGRLIGHAAEER